MQPQDIENFLKISENQDALKSFLKSTFNPKNYGFASNLDTDGWLYHLRSRAGLWWFAKLGVQGSADLYEVGNGTTFRELYNYFISRKAPQLEFPKDLLALFDVILNPSTEKLGEFVWGPKPATAIKNFTILDLAFLNRSLTDFGAIEHRNALEILSKHYNGGNISQTDFNALDRSFELPITSALDSTKVEGCQVYMSVEVDAPDSLLIHQFKEWLKDFRKQHKHQNKNFRASDWIDYRLLGYADITIFQEFFGIELTHRETMDLLFPEGEIKGKEVDLEEALRKTIRPHFISAIDTGRAIRALQSGAVIER